MLQASLMSTRRPCNTTGERWYPYSIQSNLSVQLKGSQTSLVLVTAPVYPLPKLQLLWPHSLESSGARLNLAFTTMMIASISLDLINCFLLTIFFLIFWSFRKNLGASLNSQPLPTKYDGYTRFYFESTCSPLTSVITPSSNPAALLLLAAPLSF